MLLNDTKGIKIIFNYQRLQDRLSIKINLPFRNNLIIDADESENKKKYKMRMRDKI